jgi:predicted nucleic acid-binding protein
MLIGRYPALLDANVLHPAFVRAALLWFAEERLFQPHWSPTILEEWRRSVVRRFPEVPAEKLDAQEAAMNDAFPDALIEEHECIIDALKLPDPDDRHVLAAAIVGRCSGIITCNLKHFPDDVAAKFKIEIVHPDDFIVNIIDLDPDRAKAAARRHREAMAKSAISPADFLKRYEAAGLIQAHGRLKAHVDLL